MIDTPEVAAKWLLRPQGKPRLSDAELRRRAIDYCREMVQSARPLVRGEAFWWDVVRILTKGRVGTRCDNGHLIGISDVSIKARENGGVRIDCRVCVNQGRLRYYEGHRESEAEFQRQYHQRNRDKILARHRDNYQRKTQRQEGR